MSVIVKIAADVLNKEEIVEKAVSFFQKEERNTTMNKDNILKSVLRSRYA